MGYHEFEVSFDCIMNSRLAWAVELRKEKQHAAGKKDGSALSTCCWIPSTVAYNPVTPVPWVPDAPFWPSWALQAHGTQTCIHAGKPSHTFGSFFDYRFFFLLLYTWNPEENLQESFLSFHQLCLRDGTHVVWLSVLMAGNLFIHWAISPALLLFLKIYLMLLFMSLCPYVWSRGMPSEAVTGHRISRTGIIGICKPPSREVECSL